MPAPTIRPAIRDDAAVSLQMIRELAAFERAEDAVRATVADLERDGWSGTPRFEALMPSISTITRPGKGAPASTWKICMCSPAPGGPGRGGGS